MNSGNHEKFSFQNQNFFDIITIRSRNSMTLSIINIILNSILAIIKIYNNPFQKRSKTGYKELFQMATKIKNIIIQQRAVSMYSELELKGEKSQF